MDRNAAIVMYGVWDDAHKDLISIPSHTRGDYVRTTVPNLADLAWCPDNEVVKITIEYVKKP
jgi:hypothetical protein